MDNSGDTQDSELTQWLATNKWQSYQSALEAEGYVLCLDSCLCSGALFTYASRYEVLESLTLMTTAEISELAEGRYCGTNFPTLTYF